MKKLFSFWFMKVSRGYSLPMSLTNWLVIFSMAWLHGGNVFYGILALVGFVFAQMGTNVFDDVIDHWKKVPKQKYKSTYLDNGETNLKTILILSFVYFAIAAAIGLFLTIKCGWMVAILAAVGGIIALLYPRLNHYALGELAVGLTFGPLMFAGVYYVMLGRINPQAILISIPTVIFTVVVLMVHALMDYDFDKKSGKKTLCVLVGSKLQGLNLIFSLMIMAYFMTIMFIVYNILPLAAGVAFGAIIAVVTLYNRLLAYIRTNEHKDDDFINNFALAQSIGTIYCIALAASFLMEKFL